MKSSPANKLAPCCGILLCLLFLAVVDQAAAQSCVQPPGNLLSWWPGDGNADDIKGGNDGSLQNGATFAPGMVAQAFFFDGIDDHVVIGNLGAAPTQGTIDFWVNTAIVGPLARMSLTTNAPAGDAGIRFQQDNDGLYYAVVGGDAPSLAASSYLFAPLPAGQWHHVALVWSNNGVTVTGYFDGVQKFATTSNPYFPSTFPDVRIGTGYDLSSQRSWGGLVDELEMFDRALSQVEIQTIFNAGSAGKCKVVPYACVGFEAPFDETILVKRKVNRAIPLQIQLFSGSTRVTDTNIVGPPPVVNVTYSAGSSPGVDVTDQLEPLGHADDGNVFRFDGATRWLFNLSTKPFTAPGTYTVTAAAGDTSYTISPTCIGQFIRSQ